MVTSHPLIVHTPPFDCINKTKIGRLLLLINEKFNLNLKNYNDLHNFSINNLEDFHKLAAENLGLIFTYKGKIILKDAKKMLGGQYFPDSTINFAENMLKKTGQDNCFIYRSEFFIERILSWDEVHKQTSIMQQYLKEVGVNAGDVVAGFVPNCPEAVIAMLATTSLGAIWTSCSPDFGVDGVLERFSQTKPKILFTANGYYYNNKYHNSTYKVSEIIRKLGSLKNTIFFKNANEQYSIDNIKNALNWQDIIKKYPAKKIIYTAVNFNAPAFIMYSSGTTGKPKCIVHGTGGTLLSLMIEGMYHCDINESSRVFYYSTCSWMMWNWLVGQMVAKATILLYDGSPFMPNHEVLFDFIAKYKATFMGVSAKYIDLLSKTDIYPKKNYNLSALKTVGSTGSVLLPEAFDWISNKVKKNVYISSLSGGTDILGCFLMGNPITHVVRGELVAPVLGKNVEIWDNNGNALDTGVGELMCVKPFVSMPIFFFGDIDGSKYHSAYFKKFDSFWCHGDFVNRTKTGYIIIGRSDSVLNPGGIRIGTAEIYRQVAFFKEIIESVVIGQKWHNDIRIILFVKMANNNILNDELINKIKWRIKTFCSPHHIPHKILAVLDIPRTYSGKISEIAVRDIVNGNEVKNKTALANAKCLELYKNLTTLQE